MVNGEYDHQLMTVASKLCKLCLYLVLHTLGGELSEEVDLFREDDYI